MYRYLIAIVTLMLSSMGTWAADYTTILTSDRGFTEVISLDDIQVGSDHYYMIVAAEKKDLIVGVDRYEVKPEWANENTLALRYHSISTDPVLEESNFFHIEKSGSYIGFRNALYCHDLFQTHDNAGYLYVNTYTDANLDEWSYLIPSFQNGFWLFESGKYPISSGDWACGFLGPWNNNVADGEPIALNRKNTAGDEAGHYRLFHITKSQLSTIRRQALAEAKADTPLNATWLITNPSFETGDETGWTLIDKDPNGNDEFKTRDYTMSGMDGKFLMNAYQWWAPNLSVSQTVENVPSGIYDLSAVVCTWEGRVVTFTGNETTVSQTGVNDQTGIPVTLNVNIGVDQKLNITSGSTGQWWVEGHEGETQTFFKVDNIRLTCKGVFLNGLAIPLPNDEVTLLTPGQWYYYDVSYPSDYLLIGNLTCMTCTTEGNQLMTNINTSIPQREMTLSKGRIYFCTTSDDATLRITPERKMQQGSFTAVALNVDGLPINVAGFIDINPDGPGGDGTKLISQYLAEKEYDIIGASEDFNYHGSLMKSLDPAYGSGTVRATLSVEGLIQGSYPFDTDGLNLIWKKSKMDAQNESWTRWNNSKSGEGNQYVKKGFRHYDVTIDGKYTIDVYVLHMDAGGEEYAESRHGQWSQLADAVNNSDLSRPKLIIGDTNSRWTREDIAAYFANKLSSDLTMGDVWVELWRNNIYPTPDMADLTDGSNSSNYTNYEVVDKIIYINPVAANTLQIVPQDFKIEQDYTYGHVEGTDNTTALGDHKPVVVTFSYTKSGDKLPIELEIKDDGLNNSKTIEDYNGVTANVILKDRTLHKGGVWNTLCLPFSLTQEQMAQSPLVGAIVRTLTDASLSGYHVELTFGDNVNSIAAGTPYIIKWEDGTNISDAVFEGVTIEDVADASRTISLANDHVQFIGYYDAFKIDQEDNPTLYYMNSNNQLTYTLKERTLKACRAYFLFAANEENQALDFTIDFGEEANGIEEIAGPKTSSASSSAWYTIDGRHLSTPPTTKGIYIQNGQKVIIK